LLKPPLFPTTDYALVGERGGFNPRFISPPNQRLWREPSLGIR
jgi:hypothetical protein